MPPLAFCLSVLRSAAPLLTLALLALALLALALGAACASAPIFEPTSYPARSEHLRPFAAERVRPHPGALSGDVRDARPPERRDHLNAHLASSPGQATAYLWWSLY